MGANFVIPAITKAKCVETIMEPEEDLRYLIHCYLGEDIAKVYDEILSDYKHPETTGDDWEKIADGYHTKLMDVRDELEGMLKMQRISRKAVEDLHRKVNADL